MIHVQMVPTYGDDDDDGADVLNPTAEENTRPNAAVGEGVVDVASGICEEVLSVWVRSGFCSVSLCFFLLPWLHFIWMYMVRFNSFLLLSPISSAAFSIL